MIRFVLFVSAALLLLVACSSDPIALPDPTTGASSSVGSGGTGGAGGQGGMGGNSGNGGSAPMPGDGSGSRLKRKVYASPDGLYADAAVGSFRDTALGIDCTMQTVPGGATRCMPYSGNGYPVFQDAMCATRIIAMNDPCGTAVLPYAAVSSASAQCGMAASTQWFHGGTKLAMPSAYHVDFSGNCVPFTPAGYTFFALGPEVNYAEFAPMSLGVE
jgi:hypothetical protein